MTHLITRGLHLGSLFGVGFVLAGCSLVPERVLPVGDDTPGAFQSKAQVGSVWKSEDGGKSFEPRITVDEKNRITTADILAISFLEKDPESAVRPEVAPAVYLGTVETGIFQSESGGEQWEHIAFPPKKIYSFIVDRDDAKRMFASGVVGNRGKLFRTADGGESWQDMYSEPGQNTIVLSLAQHPRDTHVIFSGTSTGTVVKSTDKGDTWRNVGQQIDGPVTEIAFDAVQPKTIYSLAFKRKVWYSNNGGVEWIDWEEVKQKEQQECQKRIQGSGGYQSGVDPCAKINDPKRAMPQNIVSLVADPRRSGRLLVGTDKGMFQSVDFGKYWDEVNIIESARQFPIRAIAINPQDSKIISFVSGKSFYKSINDGETWAVVQLNVDRDISNLVYDPFSPDVLYLGLRKF